MKNIYKYTKFTNVSRVKYAVYPLYLIGNIVDSTAVHKKPRKKSRPVFEHVLYTFYGSSIIGTIGIMIKRTLCIGIWLSNMSFMNCSARVLSTKNKSN